MQRFQVQFLSRRLPSLITIHIIFFRNYNSLKLKLKQVLQHLDWEPMVLTFSNPKTLLTKKSLSTLNFLLIHFHFCSIKKLGFFFLFKLEFVCEGLAHSIALPFGSHRCVSCRPNYKTPHCCKFSFRIFPNCSSLMNPFNVIAMMSVYEIKSSFFFHSSFSSLQFGGLLTTGILAFSGT